VTQTDSFQTPLSWKSLRQLFPATSEQVYLNTASYGPGATPILAEIQEGLEQWSKGQASWQHWERRAEDARDLFARLIECAPELVALQSSMSSSAGQVAECLPAPGKGQSANIVVGAEEFRSNLFAWMGQDRRGFELRLVPFREGRIPAEDLLAAVDGDTALVAVSHVQSANGYRVDLERLTSGLRGKPARLFVDATQSLGGLRVPLDGIDFMACTAYKWLLSPRGASYLYVAPERLEELHPIAPSWKTPQDPYAQYYGGPYEPSSRASKLDASLAWPMWLGAARALELLLEVGLERIEARNLELAGAFAEGLRGIGLAPLFSEAESSPIMALKVPDPAGLQAKLAAEGIVAAVRAEYLRPSFHFYNDESDVQRLLDVLKD
jgi:cysteine desulfurase/selenocysteine lyase